jgi:lipopolysaccharide export system protein LptA
MRKPTLLSALFGAALVWAASPSASAQSTDVGSTTDITADHLESVSTDTETTFLFTGNVTASGNNIRVTCDRLEIIASGLGDKTKITNKLDRFKYLLATGKVRIVQGDREAHCGRAEILPRDDKIVLTDKPLVIDRGSNAVWTGEPMELYRGQRMVRGDNVKMTLPELKDLGFDKKEPPPQSPPPPPPEPPK